MATPHWVGSRWPHKWWACPLPLYWNKTTAGSDKVHRLPITINILKTLKTWAVSTSITVYNKRLLCAVFTLAFYGFLRVSEFVAPSLTQYAPQSNLTARDTTLEHNQIHLHIRQSKTNPFRASHTILIAATQTSTCPVRALHIYLKLRNQCQTHSLYLRMVASSPEKHSHWNFNTSYKTQVFSLQHMPAI